MRVFIVGIGLYLVVALALPLGLMLGKSLQGPGDEFVGLANYVRYFSTPALFQSVGNSLWVSFLSTAITVPAGVRLRLRAHALAHAAARALQDDRARPDPRSLAPARARPRLPLRQPGARQGAAPRAQHLRADRHRHGRGLHDVPARAPHHPGGAGPRRRAALRGGGGAAGVAAAHLLDGDAARRALRADQRDVRRVHHRDHRLRRAQGHRRAVQRAGDRRLQAGDRPAELSDGRGRQRHAPGAGGLRVPGRSRRAPPPGGAPVGPRRALRAPPAARLRPRDARLLRRGRRRHPHDRRGLAVRGRGEVLSLQPDPDRGALRLRPEGRWRLGVLLQLDPPGAPDRRRSAPPWCSSAPT